MSKRVIQVTDLLINSAQPDIWTKMCMDFVKRVFTRKTFSDKLAYKSVLMNCNNYLSEIKLTEVEIRLGILLSTKE